MLLAGMGTGILLTIIALFVPEQGRPYAWTIAGMMFLLCVVRMLSSAKGNPIHRRRNRKTPVRAATSRTWAAGPQRAGRVLRRFISTC
ncbi:hypothetical protein [Spongiactinospora gelatinilytica]|uniref:hypothetical protein n=1 Tax=Spongiactinospora gelatinilytica TaxID=2666298 RepID=UPI0011B945B3|nr:hypothetical protein [Spongiactinospora gelatinilytica]